MTKEKELEPEDLVEDSILPLACDQEQIPQISELP